MKCCKHKIALVFFFCLVAIMGHAQVVFNFVPAINGLQLDRLAIVQIVNSTNTSLKGKINITVRETGGSELVNILTPSFLVRPGINTFDKNLFSKSIVRFGSVYTARIVQQTRKFPEGEFEYCYEFINDDKSADNNYKNCFDHTVQSLTPLSLIYPADGDEICITRPSFVWQPPLPVDPQMRYKLLLVEGKNDQSAVLAINNNLPIINQAGLMGHTILFPANAPDLIQGRQYSWQVMAYKENVVLTSSEVWSFTIRCDTATTKKTFESYRELREVAENNSYLARNKLYFSFINPYSAGIATYQVIDLTEPANKIKKLPRLKVVNGLNRVDLDISNMNLKDGHQYLLKVKRFDNRWLVMRFIYQQEENND